MFTTYLVNSLIFCAIILLIVTIVAAVQGALIMLDLRRMSKEVKDKVLAVTSMLDLVSFFLGGLDRTKKRVAQNFAADNSTFVALVAGFKKGWQVLFNKKGDDK